MKNIVHIESGAVPFAKIFISYSLGIALASYSSRFGLSLWFWGSLLGTLFFVAIVCHLIEKKRLFSVSAYLFLLIFGCYQCMKQEHRLYEQSPYRSKQLVAAVADEPILKQRSIRFPANLIAAVDSGGAVAPSGRIMVTLLKDSACIRVPKYGDRFIFANTLQPVPPPRNPKEFNYQKYLANQGIHYQLFLQRRDLVITDTATTSIMGAIICLRQYFAEKFHSYIEDDIAVGIASALVFGYRSEMDQATMTAFTNTGTVHVLSVSGLHVTLVFGLLTFLLRPIDNWRYGRPFRFIIVLLSIWGYVVLTGMAPPILRAGIMISFFVVSEWVGRRQNNINTLFASAFFILVFSPRMLWDIGFQLSYAAMLGIFLIYPLLRHFYLPQHIVLKPIVEYSYVSIAAQLATAPAALYYFGQFPNYFLLANLIIALPTTIIMYAGVGLMLMPFDVPNTWLGHLMEYCTRLMYHSLKFIDSLPYATFQGIEFHGIQVFLSLLATGTLFFAFNFRSKGALFATMVLALGLTCTAHIQAYHHRTFRGIKIYSLRRDAALAAIDKGNVTLFSTLDSLWDPALVYSVHPDLKRYTKIENITFINVPSDSSFLTHILDRKIVWHQTAGCTIPSHDLLLVRNNCTVSSDRFWGNTKLIVDGSNSWQSVRRLKERLGQDSTHCYVLKDNFAYVWARE